MDTYLSHCSLFFQDSDTETTSSDQKSCVTSGADKRACNTHIESKEFRSSRGVQKHGTGPTSREGSCNSVSSNRSSASSTNYRPSSNNYSNNYSYYEQNHNRNSDVGVHYYHKDPRPQTAGHNKHKLYGTQGKVIRNSTAHRRRRNSSNGNKTMKDSVIKDRYQQNSNTSMGSAR